MFHGLQIVIPMIVLVRVGGVLHIAPLALSLAATSEDVRQLGSMLNMRVGNVTFTEEDYVLLPKLMKQAALYSSPYVRAAPAFIGAVVWHVVHSSRSEA